MQKRDAGLPADWQQFRRYHINVERYSLLDLKRNAVKRRMSHFAPLFYHRHYKGSGHVWQGRFKAFPVQSDEHCLTVLRYVERNPLRANMVQRSQDWEWSSLKPTARSGPDGLLCDGPILKPAQWTRHVNGVETEAELKALRHSLARGTPFGDTRWQTKTARILGLESSLRPRGRPKQQEK